MTFIPPAMRTGAEAHFIIQARERGFGDEAPALYADLCLALRRLKRGEDQDGDYVERVIGVRGAHHTDLDLYRFRVRDGRLGYFLARGAHPVTYLKREFVEHYKARRAPLSKRVVRGKRQERA